MQRIYLDQNKWIELARARTGHPGGRAYIAAYEAAMVAVRNGSASFPLSSAHYYETHKQADSKRRVDVANTMVELSRLDAIAPPHVIVPYEIEVALIKILNLANRPPPPVKLFGKGANHVHATTIFTYTVPDEIDGHVLPADLKDLASKLGQRELERVTLADEPEFGTRLRLNQQMRLTGNRFVDGQNRVRDILGDLGRHRLDAVITATAMADIISPLLAIAGQLGTDLEQLFGSGTMMATFVESMPSRWVEAQLRRLRQSNPQRLWEGNDLNDVAALSIATPYCDIVVTERSWAAMINDRKINQRFKTRVLYDLRELPSLLSADAS